MPPTTTCRPTIQDCLLRYLLAGGHLDRASNPWGLFFGREQHRSEPARLLDLSLSRPPTATPRRFQRTLQSASLRASRVGTVQALQAVRWITLCVGDAC